MKRLNNQGIGHIIVLIAAFVVVGIAFVGWRVTQVDPNDTTAISSSKAKIPATIKNTADLQKASKALDTTPIDNSLDTTSLDSAINNLL